MSPDTFIITTGGIDYKGPVTLVAWMFIHPWMTFFLLGSFFSAIEAWGKAASKRRKK